MLTAGMYSSPEFDVHAGDSPSPRVPCPYVEKTDEKGTFYCDVCHLLIRDRFLLRMNDGTFYHESCLRCSECGEELAGQNNCYKRDGAIFCKTDYQIKFSKRCARCERIICPKMDWIRKATTMYYHLACFLCAVCGRQLSTGECFKLIDGSILCEKHCVDPDLQKEEINQKAKTKRVRTTFTEEQIRILMDHFVHDCNPDGADLEMIAKRTGLTKRVTQVWFQNSRARQKKHQQQHPGDKKNNNTTTANNNNNSFNPSGLLSGIPSVGSDHSSELPTEMHSFSTSSEHSEDWSPVEDDDRLSGLTSYIVECQ